MKPYSTVLIADCGEPLAPIALAGVTVLQPHPYEKLGADYGGQSPFVLRTGVLNSLQRAAAQLQQWQPGWQILVFDAYRPVAVQRFMVEHTFGEIVARDGLDPQQLTPGQRQDIYQQVYKIWAIPSDDPLTPPPHSTGAALDITLLDEQGQAIYMGGEIDELSPRSLPHYYQGLAPADAQQQQRFALYQQRRDLLNQVMEDSGFLRHPGEWWHFSQGDQMWAWQCNQRRPGSVPSARYGRVS